MRRWRRVRENGGCVGDGLSICRASVEPVAAACTIQPTAAVPAGAHNCSTRNHFRHGACDPRIPRLLCHFGPFCAPGTRRDKRHGDVTWFPMSPKPTWPPVAILDQVAPCLTREDLPLAFSRMALITIWTSAISTVPGCGHVSGAGCRELH